jgi:heme-degrading monooxygenase HmoA
VIARVWAAQTTAGQLPAYLEHLRASVLPGLQGLDGYSGVTVLDRPLSEGIEVIVITYWRSIDAIRAFAGGDVEKAVVAKEAAAMLSRFDERVRHYVVAHSDGSVATPRAQA